MPVWVGAFSLWETSVNKKTGWYEPDQKPVHIGVYQIRYVVPNPGTKAYLWARWLGKEWGAGYDAYKHAAESGLAGGIQHKAWRGLAAAPTEQK